MWPVWSKDRGAWFIEGENRPCAGDAAPCCVPVGKENEEDKGCEEDEDNDGWSGVTAEEER